MIIMTNRIDQQDFQGHTQELREAKGACDPFDDLASNFIAAADWENEEGKNIASAVGTNSALDMDRAVVALVDYQKACKNCGTGACIFAGFKGKSPTEISSFIRNQNQEA